ncbi:hypothetical protein JOD57_000578 [Geodermatophilus bullaregiensis]|uniref:hypothetical protein n=1 Tax=Geodermatophilus bullaregiensis TaxID=1564160 RepID=UPI001957AB9B|nr:hypothetical protein [Geodermatophilus bullaregiensis]MBM7804741.1 hypothetical protein [Geodermatophilus bullaregiensis]
MSSPWSDPAAQADPVAYAGPPVTAPAPYAAAAYPPPGPYTAAAYPHPGYGWPGHGVPVWGPPAPLRPRRPGQVVAAAVLAFVQAGLVAVASAYVLLLASTFGFLATVPGASDADEAGALVTEATVLTVVQLLSAIALVVGGVMVLNRRSRASWLTLVAAVAAQLALALYWLVRLSALGGFLDDTTGSDPSGVLVVGVLFFAAAPAVGLGLLLVGAVRRWAAGDDAAPGTGR